jgi:hypothetical protein
MRMEQVFRTAVVAVLCTLPLAGRSETTPIPFTVTITPKVGGVSAFSFLNESTEPITGILIEKDSSSGSTKFLKLKDDCLSSGIVETPTYNSSNDVYGAVREVYAGVPYGSPASLINSCLEIAATNTYPDEVIATGLFGGVTSRSQIKTGFFQTSRNAINDYHVQRLHAYVKIPATGTYRFKMTTDDNGVLTYEKTSSATAARHALPVPPLTCSWPHLSWIGLPFYWDFYSYWSWDTFAYNSSTNYYSKNDVVYVAAYAIDTGGNDHIRIGWSYKPADDPTVTVDEVIPIECLSTTGANGWPNLNRTPINPTPIVNEPSFTIRIKDIGTLGWGGNYALTSYFEDTTKKATTELWNLSGARTPTKVTVMGAYGNQGSLTLGSTASTELDKDYVFKTTDRPLKLSVQSVDDGGNIMTSLNRFSVEIWDPSITDGPLVSITNPASGTYSHLYLRRGMQVHVTVPSGVYFDRNGGFLYESGDDSLTQSNAYERYEAAGLSINNSAPTGDATEYEAELQQDLTVKIRWKHQYALRVRQDFAQTASMMLNEEGSHWAGPLISGASGSPTHDAMALHWIDAGVDVVDQIDGYILDTSHAGMNLDVRFVPYAYIAEGSALGIHWSPNSSAIWTNAFIVGQAPASRQQVEPYTMRSWATLTYRWKLQYGVRLNSLLGTGGGNLGRVYDAHGLVGALDGVYWFDEGVSVKVLAQANVDSATSQALSGWSLGDGYYFSLSGGTIDTGTGALSGSTSIASADGSPVARWIKSVTLSNSPVLRGMDIPSLNRPVYVSWQYGDQVFTDPSVPIGESVFQGMMTSLPDAVRILIQSTAPSSVTDPSAIVWDGNAGCLYPLKPGDYTAVWTGNDLTVTVRFTAVWPASPHYRHIANTPLVELTPDAAGNFLFKKLAYTENAATVIQTSQFSASSAGKSVLQFSEVKKIGRGEPKEYVRIRVVQTTALSASLAANPIGTVVIGRAVRDSLDLANLGTGYLVYQSGVRYNTDIYAAANLIGLRITSVYDLVKLRSITAEKVVVNPGALPGPIIAVNLHPSVPDANRITVVWYNDPATNDGILWPYAARKYTARWPVGPSEGLGRIVIASEYGSESVGSNGLDQVVAVATNGLAEATTYDPARFSDLKVYAQNASTQPGYNPNEEHALLAPSLRYADVSPRPYAVYALRNNDLNNLNGQYTSDPYVLVQFYDTFLKEYGMRVYRVQKEDADRGYRFATRSLISVANQDYAPNVTVTTSGENLTAEPHKEMEAGEPVIPFYPLGVVEGAVPSPESFGQNIKGQLTFWKDHKYTRWSVSGGTNAWFTVSAFYPLQGNFWWPSSSAATLNLGDRLPFLPTSLTLMQPATNLPTKILYKSDWPSIAPVLKSGETITYSGGEYRTDHPTMVVDGETIQTPGLPAVVAFAVTEVVFDNMNPQSLTNRVTDLWTVRSAQVMETRRVALANTSFPDELRPAAGNSTDYKGKYFFKNISASLQKRVAYDPIAGMLEIKGFLNEKDNTDSTLTASPGAVYVLEPNILTAAESQSLADLSEDAAWRSAVTKLYNLTRNPNGLNADTYGNGRYSVGLQPKVARDVFGVASNTLVNGMTVPITNPNIAENARSFGVGTALVPNGAFMDPLSDYPEISWVTVAENNDSSMGGSPVTLHIIKVMRNERYRGAIKTVFSDNVFDENVVLRHTGDFGANVDGLAYEWWYRPDDGSLAVPPPFTVDANSAGDWKLFPDLSGKNGVGRNEVLLKGDPNAPETLLADSWWFVRYRHTNDTVQGSNWAVTQPDHSNKVNYEWAGAGNSDPFHDNDQNGYPDYKAQLCMGWVKRVLDAVNPYEARIADFTGDAPTTISSMLQQLGPRYEGAVALNPDKDVIENVGLIELYQTVLNRASDLSINLSTPVSTPAIANALQLASTRLSDFYMLLGNEAYVDAKDPTIGYGSSSVEYGAAAPSVFAFQNQVSSLLEEELDLLRGQDDNMARPVYNRLFWNFTKGEGEAAYAMNYNISDINKDGFINEDDAMALYPQGHGDAWGHYLTALTQQYNLLRNPYFNWVSRSEFYNLNDVVMKVDFLDERKFAQIAAQRAKTGAEIVNDTYRDYYVEDETAQWQGYTDVNRVRAWGVQDWARRAGQGAYFDWITANALLPSVHPNETLTGIQKVDRQENGDIAVISANLNQIQTTLNNADNGLTPLGISSQAVPFDINPYSWDDGVFGRSHFEQIYDRAIKALANAKTAWDVANEAQNRLRAIANNEQEFRNDVYQQDISYRNQLIEIFGRPYPGTVGSGKFYPDSYLGPDLTFYMYVGANSTAYENYPKPSTSEVQFNGSGNLNGGTLYAVLESANLLKGTESYRVNTSNLLYSLSSLFGDIANTSGNDAQAKAADGLYVMSAADFDGTNNPLAILDFELPVTASTYSLVAPNGWGDRPAVGDIQTVIAEMLQEQIVIAQTLGNYKDMWLDLYRAIDLMTVLYETKESTAARMQDWLISKSVIKTVLSAAQTLFEILEETGDTITKTASGAIIGIPSTTPTVGLANSLGDALAPVKAATLSLAYAVESGMGWAGVAAKIVEFINEAAMEIAQDTVDMYNADDERKAAYAELIAGIDDALDNEANLRADIFAHAEQLRSLGDKYRTLLVKGGQIIDEREAFNKRVSAMVQQNRYQDMTFRVQRNHALQNYNRLLDIAARYVYLAAKAYDYDTNLEPDDPGSPSALFREINKARTIGLLDGSGVPQLGDGLAGILAQLEANYDVLSAQLGLINPQLETGKISLRSEKYRIFPFGYEPSGDTSGWVGLADADTNWKDVLNRARVNNLWDVPEFRFLARPFASEVKEDGTRAVEPGIVLRFSTEVTAGKNVFGHPLSGGDHAYDPSVYANRIRKVGVWFSNYQSADVLNDLSAAPRVYLMPTGVDVMSVPNALSPERVRVWNVLDQSVPVPVSGIDAMLPYSNFVPLLDSLDGRIGLQRRFSSFRAYHDAGDEVNTDELVTDFRLVGRSVWNTGWTLIIPGRTLNADPQEGLDRFIGQVTDIKLIFETYGFSGN